MATSRGHARRAHSSAPPRGAPWTGSITETDLREHALSPETRLYSSAIAVVSGLYSGGPAAAAMASRPMGIGVSGSIMLVIGAAVLVHGIVLLTPAAVRLGRASGPLMVLWAAIMLGNQALAATIPASAMTSSSSMAFDGGMVAIAVLMLASGLIMSRRGMA